MPFRYPNRNGFSGGASRGPAPKLLHRADSIPATPEGMPEAEITGAS